MRRATGFLFGVATTAGLLVVAATSEGAAPVQGVPDAGAMQDAAVPRGCSVELTGEVEAKRSCEMKQEYESQASDGGMALVHITTVGPLPMSTILFRVEGTPARGRVPDVSLKATIGVFDGTSKWAATAWPHSITRGAIKVVLTSVRNVKVRGQDAYELHGEIDASLVPDNHEATGRVDLHAVF